MGIYEGYAALYDASGQHEFSLRMIPYLERLLARHPVEGRNLIDLACGTGTVALSFAQKGWQVTGIDASAGMLAQAKAKQRAVSGELAITWSQQDMREFQVTKPAHLMTCLYDSMNYMLSDRDLLHTFEHVYSALAPGGLFVFDMNTAWVMAAQWDDETYFSDSEELSIIFQSAYDDQKQRTQVKVTCFQRVNDLYRRVVEHHIEQAYPPEQIATLLVDAGLRPEAQYNCFTFAPSTPTTFRIMFVARRPK